MHFDGPDLKGLTLAGKYLLLDIVREEQGAAVYQTEHQGTPALIYVVPDGTSEAEWRQQQWTAARNMEHAQIVRILDGGFAEIQDQAVLYCVMEKPDETVAGVLEDRPLTVDEATHILKSVIPALRHLHAGGWLHGNVSSTGIVALGDQVKLTIESLAPGNTTAAFAEEVQDLGRVIAEMLHADSSWTGVPGPLAEMGRGLSNGTWQLVDAERVLKGRTQEPAPVIEPAVLPEPRWKVAAAVAGGAVILALPFAFWSTPTQKQQIEIPPGAVNQPITTSTPPTGRERTVDPAPAATAAPPSKADGDWAVVAAIYRDHASALKRAEALKAKWKRGDVEVYPPAGQGNRFMVVAARGLTRKEAERVRAQARASGLPRDTYITRLR